MRKTLFFATLMLFLLSLCVTALAWYCPNCGKANDYNFCTLCGTPQPYFTAQTSGSSKPWPVVTLPMTQVYFHPSGDGRVLAYCGPTNLPEAGAYKTMKMRSTYALFTEGNYTLIDMDYMTVGHRRLYFRKSAYPKNTYDIPAFDYTACPAATTKAVTPLWGPGSDYDTFGEAAIPAGTSLSVFLEEDGYVFAEFTCKLGVVRAWIDTDHVKAQ